MFFIVGIIIVLASVLIGHYSNGGNLAILIQSHVLIVILGTALGTLFISYPMSCLRQSIASLVHFFRGRPYNKQDYMELLLFSFVMFRLMKIKGMVEVESHIEDKNRSEIFNLASFLRREPFAQNFISDNLRLMTMGIDSPYQLEELLDKEINNYRSDVEVPGNIFLNLGDSLPALGIVAAVLGVMVTMGSIVEPPEILGALIGVALVGTFLGVLMAYGLFNPMGNFLHKYAERQEDFLECIKIGFVSYLNGNPPIVIVEFMRKTINKDLRPSFNTLDSFINENSIKTEG